jgi:FMN phosphatase YigB (HAD superfamily)
MSARRGLEGGVARRAILFDLFDTLVCLDRSRLPEVHVNGRTIRSTGGRLHEVFRPFAPGVELGEFVAALLWSWQEAERLRNVNHREVPAPERFALLFRRLGLEPSMLAPEAVKMLLLTHMKELSRAVVVPAHHGPMLRELRGRYRLAVVSNFDYTPTAHYILEREGIADVFETIIVSDEIGWRKPEPVIFETALRRLRVEAAEALFVGDRADIDVAGAQGVGMAAVWINRDGVELPDDAPAPEFEIRDLRELAEILRIQDGPAWI